jgi:hypothetical protein
VTTSREKVGIWIIDIFLRFYTNSFNVDRTEEYGNKALFFYLREEVCAACRSIPGKDFIDSYSA